jgi:hypothetical protein
VSQVFAHQAATGAHLLGALQLLDLLLLLRQRVPEEAPQVAQLLLQL